MFLKNKKSIVSLIIASSLALCFTGCKEDKTEDSVTVKETTETKVIYNLGDFSFVLYMENGEEVMYDNNGNKMSKNENGEWVDGDGNVIDEYKDARDSNSENSNDGDSPADNNVGARNQEPLSYNQAMAIIDNGGVAVDNGVGQADYFTYDNNIGDYNPQTGSKGIEPGTALEFPIMLSNGVEIKGYLNIDSITDTNNSCGVKATVSYDVEEYLKYCNDTYGDTVDVVNDAGEIVQEAVDYNKALNETTIDCGIVSVDGYGNLQYNDGQQITLTSEGSNQVEFSVECDNSSGNAMLVFDGYYLAVGN